MHAGCPHPVMTVIFSLLATAALGAASTRAATVDTINDVDLQQRFVAQVQDDGLGERTLSPEEITRIFAGPSGPPVQLGDLSRAVVAKPASLYGDCKPAVVAIGSLYKCGGCPDWHANFSSGWLVSPQGHVVTNHHVLAKRKTPSCVMTADGTAHPIAEVCAFDAVSDMVVIRIDTGGQAMPFLRLADDVSTGEEIAIISHPLNRLWFFSKGVVARVFQRSREPTSPIWMTVSADFAIGSSGAPVLNQRGEVVGMATYTKTVFTEDSKEPQMTERSCVSLPTLRQLLTKE